jgi:hypothetical protein
MSHRFSERLTTWLLFTVVFSLLPIAAGLLFDLDHASGLHITHIARHGELLVVAVTITAAALGELLLTGLPSHARGAALIEVGGAIALMLIAGFWFADVSRLQAPLVRIYQTQV